MSLLLHSDIQEGVNTLIRGNVARIGGRMNQLLTYKNCKVTDINVVDGGYGKVRPGVNVATGKELYFTIKRQIRQELAWFLKGESESRDRKTIVLDMHFAVLEKRLEHCFDASVSSNVIEHSPNPVWLLLNFYFITKENGYQFHAVPHYRYTFDQYRKPTPSEHLIEDFEKMTWFNDTTHNEDYIMSAVDKHGWQKAFHEKYPVTYPYIHFHVWDENNLRELAGIIFEDVTLDILKNEKNSDNLLLFKNKLKPSFICKYQPLINKYEEFFCKKELNSDPAGRNNIIRN